MDELSSDLLNGAKEAAAFIGLPTRTVYAMVENGQLPVIRMGKRLYFRRSALQAAFSCKAA